MDDNKKEKDEKKIEKKSSQEEKIEQAKKEMEELMKSLNEEVGGQSVKVVQLQIPKATFKNFLFTLFLCLIINNLLIVGTSGFFEFIKWEKILDLILFATYFTIVERILEFLFLKFFTPLIIRTMGLAHVIPIIISLAIVLLFPLFVNINAFFITLITMVFIHVCKGAIINYIQNKILFRKIRRKK